MVSEVRFTYESPMVSECFCLLFMEALPFYSGSDSAPTPSPPAKRQAEPKR